MSGFAGTLAERDGELAEIAALLERARGGAGGVLLLEGPPGIGKSALLDAAAAAPAEIACCAVGVATSSAISASGSCASSSRHRCGPPPTISARAGWRVRRAPPGRSSAPGRRVSRETRRRSRTGSTGCSPRSPAKARSSCVADDLQWCDVASLRWLVYLARRIDGLAVALIAACRPPEPGEQSLVQALAASANTTVLRPRPLGPAATGELIAERLGQDPADEFTRACHDATGGNPFLLGELLAGVRAAGLAPEGANAGALGELAGDRLRPAVLTRLAQLEPPAVQLARAVAVLGDGCDLQLAAELAELDTAAALASVPPLIAAGVLADRQPLAFEHPLLRTAVYLDSPAPVRAAEHARAAELLADAHAEAEAVSHHLLLAGPVREAWAAVTLREAAQTALARGAPEASAAYLRRALEEPLARPVRADLVRALANALVRRGDPAAFAALEEALALARDSGRPHRNRAGERRSADRGRPCRGGPRASCESARRDVRIRRPRDAGCAARRVGAVRGRAGRAGARGAAACSRPTSLRPIPRTATRPRRWRSPAPPATVAPSRRSRSPGSPSAIRPPMPRRAARSTSRGWRWRSRVRRTRP